MGLLIVMAMKNLILSERKIPNKRSHSWKGNVARKCLRFQYDNQEKIIKIIYFMWKLSQNVRCFEKRKQKSPLILWCLLRYSYSYYRLFE